jgi:hypothetical protein
MALRTPLVALILGSAAAFVVGVGMERSLVGEDHHEVSESGKHERTQAAERREAAERQRAQKGAAQRRAAAQKRREALERARIEEIHRQQGEPEGAHSEAEELEGAHGEESAHETGHAETARPTDTVGAAHTHGERRARAEAARPEGRHERGSERSEEDEEGLLGINLEAPTFVALAVFVSLALALAAWLRPRGRGLLLVIALAMLGFALMDVREVLHQLDGSRSALALLAVGVAVLHLFAAGVAIVMRSRAQQPAT